MTVPATTYVYVYIQEGGASGEYYLHVFDTCDDAEAGRRSCEEGAYRTTDIVTMPADTDWDSLQNLLETLTTLDFP